MIRNFRFQIGEERQTRSKSKVFMISCKSAAERDEETEIISLVCVGILSVCIPCHETGQLWAWLHLSVLPAHLPICVCIKERAIRQCRSMYLTACRFFLKHLLASIPAGMGKSQNRRELNSEGASHYMQTEHGLDQRPPLFDVDILE